MIRMFDLPDMRALAVLLPIATSAAAQSPLRLASPITAWDEAIPLGNGLMGALVWGGDSVITLSIDRGDLWDERRPLIFADSAWNWRSMQALVKRGDMSRFHQLFDEPYDQIPYPTKLPGGRIVLTWADHAIDRFELDAQRAEAWVIAGADTLKVAVRRDRDVIAVQTPGRVTVALVPPAGMQRLGAPLATLVHGAGALAGSTTICFTQPTATGGFALAVDRWPGSDTTLLAATIRRGIDCSDDRGERREALALLADSGWDVAQSPHRAWWDRFWRISSVSIPDPRLQAQYDFAKYLYGAAARRGGPPIALQGLWTADNGALPPWKGDYHNDLNTEMTYRAAHVAGMDDAMMGWLDYLEARLPLFRTFARDFYQVDGAVIPGVMSLGGKPLGGWGMYALSPTNGIWVGWSFWKHWRMTRDPRFLRDHAWPFLHEIGIAVDHLLTPDSLGHLVLPLSSSPEFGDNRREAFVTPNSNYDQALIQWLFGALAELAGEQGNWTAADYWSERGALLAPLISDSTGALMVARGLGYSGSHRHFSQAMSIHPLELALDSVTVSATLDQIAARGTSQWTGYSFAWFAAMLARSNRADSALRYLTDYLSFTSRNGFHLNGDQSGRGLSSFTYQPFTLEGNFLAMDAIHEMLLRSDGSRLELFPATPEEWSNVGFERLRADGGWTVSAERRNGRVVSVEVTAGRDAILRLRDPFGGAEPEWQGAQVVREGNDWMVTLQKGRKLRGTRMSH